ncbi:restriction endonuclease subunit S [Kitasatospora sp. NPDC057692]|uniref:restriction endonuclease subunit S n=1 Tax=Kitasatospora sp. NPDC057692 TaxID=3346215 RepID=UPI0036C415E9
MTGNLFDGRSEQVGKEARNALSATKRITLTPETDTAFKISNHRVQLRRFVKFLTSGSRGWGDYYADQGDVFVRIGNLPRLSLQLGGEIQRVDLPSHVREGQRTRLREGDLLFSITAYIGSVAVVESGWVDAYVSQHVALCRLDLARLDPRFVGYFMLGTEGQDQLLQGAVGGTKVQLALDDIRGLRIPVPPLEEQQRIAAHLDRELAKIDTLIAAQERFVGLLEERREAVVRSAVPVPGQSEWKADKLGRRSIISNGSTPRREEEKYWLNGHFPWLNSSVVNLRSVVSADQFVTGEAMVECHLPIAEPNDILVALTGQGKTRGMATILKIRATINQHLACIHADRARWDPEYLLWSLKSAYRDLRHASDANGATKGGLTVDALKRHVLVMPPLEEQRRIVDYLNRETAKIDTLIAKTQRHIELARERRIALITAAVTGQINFPEEA